MRTSKSQAKPTRFVVFMKSAPRSFKGILGPIQLHAVHFLLAGGTQLLQENVPGDAKSAVSWYSSLLEQQDIPIRRGWKEANGLVWLEVDNEKLDINEFASWKEVDPNDQEQLAWRTFWIPCKFGTSEEALGLLAPASSEWISEGISVANLLKTALESSP